MESPSGNGRNGYLRARITVATNTPFFLFFPQNDASQFFYGPAFKQAVEWMLAFGLLVISSPIVALSALALRLESPGPVFFYQKRGGLQGKPFTVIKLRTLLHTAGKDKNVPQVVPDDPRLTRVGHWLRRFSIDELPQLINVLRGEMALVGPRPHALPHDRLYRGLIPGYDERYRVKPGLTGWAQVHGLRGPTQTIDKMEERVKYDRYYVQHRSLWLDIKIMLRTVLTVFPIKKPEDEGLR